MCVCVFFIFLLSKLAELELSASSGKIGSLIKGHGFLSGHRKYNILGVGIVRGNA